MVQIFVDLIIIYKTSSYGFGVSVEKPLRLSELMFLDRVRIFLLV